MAAERTVEEQARLDAALADALALAESERARSVEHKAKFLEPKITLGAITAGLGVPEATTRNWLTRKQLDLSSEGERAPGKWRLFSMRDAVVLSVAHQLSRVGVPVSVFAPIAARIGDYAANMGRIVASAPPRVLLFNDGEWRHTFTNQITPSDLEGIPSAFVMLDVRRVIVDALGALDIHVTIGPAEEHQRSIDQIKVGG